MAPVIRAVRLIVVATALAAVATAVWASSAQATSSTFAIEPASGGPYFEISSRPGAVIRSAVRVINIGTRTASVDLYRADATTGQTTGAVYLSDAAPPSDAGAWLTLSRIHVTLAPGQSRLIGFVLRVPAGAGPGQHLAGLVAQPSDYITAWIKRRPTASFRVNVRELAIVAVQVDLPGPQREQLSITGVRTAGRPGYQGLEIGLANHGNMLVRGRGVVKVTTADGQDRFVHSFLIDTFVPHTEIEDPIALDRRLAAGHYVATITIHYGHGHSETRTFGFAVSSAQVAETFGSTPLSGSGGQSAPEWALGLCVVMLVSVSCAGFTIFFRRRLTDRGRPDVS